MKQKLVWRFWCEHCHKGGCGKWQMERHEKHCTLNPNRECRMCGDRGRDYAQLAQELSKYSRNYSFDEDHCSISKKGVDWLRKELDGCPACMLAVLRMGKMWNNDWQYKTEHEAWWTERNSEYLENAGY